MDVDVITVSTRVEPENMIVSLVMNKHVFSESLEDIILCIMCANQYKFNGLSNSFEKQVIPPMKQIVHGTCDTQYDTIIHTKHESRLIGEVI